MAKIIKGDDVAREPLSAFGLEEIQARCQEYIDEANRQAREIIARTHEQSKEIKKQAVEIGFREGRKDGFEKGFQEGLNKGRNDGLQKLAEETAGLDQAMQETIRLMNEAREDLRQSAEADLLQLALEVARRIVKTALVIPEETARANVTEAIRLTANRRFLRVFVHPQNLEQIRAFKPKLLAQFNEMEKLELAADPSLTPGGALVTTNTGKVDLDIRTQLQRLEAELFARYRRGDGSDLLFEESALPGGNTTENRPAPAENEDGEKNEENNSGTDLAP